MGCDIHGWIEGKVGGKWVALSPLKDRDRDYALFADLAGVRGNGPEPRGIPQDVSDGTRFHIDGDGDDGHSHSWLPLDEAVAIFKKHAAETKRQWYAEFELAGLDEHDIARSDEWRLVFWFDN